MNEWTKATCYQHKHISKKTLSEESEQAAHLQLYTIYIEIHNTRLCIG